MSEEEGGEGEGRRIQEILTIILFINAKFQNNEKIAWKKQKFKNT